MSEPQQPPKTAVVCKVVMLQTKLPDFLTTEASSIEPQRLCPGYKGCRDCAHLAACTSYIENQQQLLIERSLTLDLEAKKWVGSYNYSCNPAVLHDNSMLARSIFQKQQKRLDKNRMLQPFNDAFAEAVSRRVFTLATKEELEYTGPIYYSSLVEAYKEDSAS
ncbi:MAG: hypothetical protein GY696_18435 [Gammaproteobacteria bacterium]|nr:hypothetical protein [Gammaproteobacteria bacterium]